MTTNILRLKHDPHGFKLSQGPSKPLFALEYHKTYLDKDALDISPDPRYLLHEFHGMTPEEWSRKGSIYKPAGAAFQHQPTQQNGLDSKWSNTSWNDTILISGKTHTTPPDFSSQYYPLPVLFNSKGSRVFGKIDGGPQETDSIAQELFEEIERDLLKEKLRKEIQTSGKPIELTHLVTNSQHIPNPQRDLQKSRENQDLNKFFANQRKEAENLEHLKESREKLRKEESKAFVIVPPKNKFKPGLKTIHETPQSQALIRIPKKNQTQLPPSPTFSIKSFQSTLAPTMSRSGSNSSNSSTGTVKGKKPIQIQSPPPPPPQRFPEIKRKKNETDQQYALRVAKINAKRQNRF